VTGGDPIKLARRLSSGHCAIRVKLFSNKNKKGPDGNIKHPLCLPSRNAEKSTWEEKIKRTAESTKGEACTQGRSGVGCTRCTKASSSGGGHRVWKASTL